MATIKGKMLYIYPTQQLTSKSGNTFQKRDFVVAVQRFDPETGEVSVDDDNTPVFSVFGDRCPQLDALKAGDTVTVTYNLRGRRYRDDNNKERIINDIDVRSVRGENQPAQQPASRPSQTASDTKPKDPADDLPF